MEENQGRYRDVHSIMAQNAEHYGAKKFMISLDQNRDISFSEFNRRCNKIANFFKEKGIKKGDVVSIIGKNAIETLNIYFGVLKYGAIANPINFEESKENIYHIVGRVKPKFVIYDEEMKFDQTDTPYSWIPFSTLASAESRKGEFFSIIENCDSVFDNPLGGKEDIAEIVFTSGTTERPKGVVISREALFWQVYDLIERLNITEEDRILDYRAYSWLSPQILSILVTMQAGATLVLGEKFSRSRFPTWLKEHNVTVAVGVPTVINMLVGDPVDIDKNHLPSLRYMTSSSAPLSAEKNRDFERIYAIPINQLAGSSEGGWVCANPPEKRKIGSAGPPVQSKELFILDEQGLRCDVGEEGEIVYRGKSNALGYLNEDGGIDRFPEEGFHTGDLGYIDPEGYVFFTGRKKDLIIRGGVNISPMEISNRLMEHPDVKEAATIGIPDEIYGEEVACFIVPKPGCEMKKEDIVCHCENKLPEFKRPKAIWFLEEIPKSERGKPSKQALLNLVSQDKFI
ncbi:MAG: class I adenylate-forming enzyme family protein [Desulfatiglandales bacterium]